MTTLPHSTHTDHRGLKSGGSEVDISSTTASPLGTLALIGGRFEADNDALFSALRARCDARIAILSMASGYPEEVGLETVEEFRHQGIAAELLPIFFENRETSAYDTALVEKLRNCGSVFFTGGDQSRIVGTLLQNGKETPILTALRRLYADGGLIAGSSAGAAIMSGPMILSGTSLNAMSRGLEPETGDADDFDRFRLGEGLGFFTWGIVDQHFLARGRVGRLIRAAQHSGDVFAFGVDENSALIVRDNVGKVVGETGVLFIDLRRARFDHDDYIVQGAQLSYLDDGDSIDLRRGKPIPAADKRRTRVGRNAYRTPAPVRRHAFASYGLHDLMLRLIEADPKYYSRDSVSAFDALRGNQVTLNIERQPRRSRALRAVRDGEIRYTALKFNLDIHRASLDTCPLFEGPQLMRVAPSPEARLLLLGNSPTDWRNEGAERLREELIEPVGILATASGEPSAMADRYLSWLKGHNIEAEVLPIALHNIERASRDRTLLRRVDRMGSLLLTGGDQRRLTDALLHCADATPVLHSVVTAYERGVPVIAVSGAATALGAQMIAEGDSVAALRYGSSEDASFSGVVVERGIGLTRIGLIDQHFVRRHRLGRLLIACAQRQQRFGFGLCEGSGMIVHGNESEIEAVGSAGVIIVELDLERVRLAPGHPDPAGVRLYILEPGQRTRLDQLAALTARRSATATALLEEALNDLADDYRVALGSNGGQFDVPLWQQTLRGAATLQ